MLLQSFNNYSHIIQVLVCSIRFDVGVRPSAEKLIAIPIGANFKSELQGAGKFSAFQCHIFTSLWGIWVSMDIITREHMFVYIYLDIYIYIYRYMCVT